VKDLDQSLKGKHVLLVEDIVDTGLTMQYLLQYLEGRGPLSVRVAALLSKPGRRMVDVPVHYLGFEIDDAYVYGYGLDIAHRFRNLPFVTSLAPGASEP
jgi:hypoxanthine phosphoribosyltransferase